MKKILLQLLFLLFFTELTAAHTTVLVPRQTVTGRKVVKIIHFHPCSASGLMGIRLDVEDTPELKGLKAIYMIHKGKLIDLRSAVVADFFAVGEDRRETYTLPLDRQSGFAGAGDYVIVVEHRPHWKKAGGFYRKKIAKLYLNHGGMISDWPRRLLAGAPEIIPLVAPYDFPRGALFRAVAVDDRGQPLPYARIEIEFLNARLADDRLLVGSNDRLDEALGSRVIFADLKGNFAFIPPRVGLWTLTLVDGDAARQFNRCKLVYDSSLSFTVR